MAKETLSQDLPAVDSLDILGDSTDVIEETLNVIPEETKVETNIEAEVEVKEEKKEPEIIKEEVSLDSILGDTKGIEEEINEVVDKTEEIKDTIEEAKTAIQEEDVNSAEKFIDTLYEQVIEYSTKVDTLSAKNDILQSKLIDLTNSNTDFELQIAQNAGVSNDPKMIVLNRMYDDAVTGEGSAKDKVITTLEDMYYSITGKSFDETRIDKVSDANADEVILNELTNPVIEEEQPEEMDLTDISSIF